MKTPQVIGLSLVWAATVFAAPLDAQTAADVLWHRIEELQAQSGPEPQRIGNRSVFTRGYFEALEQRGKVLGDAALQFAESFPDDPRRWKAIAVLTKVYRPIIQNIEEDVEAKGWEAVTLDASAQAAWRARVMPHVQRLIGESEVSAELRLQGYDYWVAAALPAQTPATPTIEQLAVFRKRLDEMRVTFPQEKSAHAREWQYLSRLRMVDPDAVMKHLDLLTNDPVQDIAKWARGERNTELLRQHPLELVFTALDGRLIDLKKYRGKVVLLDFWATWCGPCIAEIPTIKAVYERYHNDGFEVIAVSLDKPGDRQKLVNFVNERQLPWPQHFMHNDTGRNVLAEKYGVIGIPAMFLFDQSGLLVTTNARGEKLEAEVKRLLGL